MPRLCLCLAAALVCVACDRPTGQTPDNLNVRVASQPGASSDSSATGNVLTVAGTNGTLVLKDVGLIVSRLELEASDGSCDSAQTHGDDDECQNFNFRPRFVRLPLNSAS